MNNKSIIAVIAYITWIGFIIAFIMGRNDKFIMHHVNQALVINLAGLISAVFGVIPILGALVAAVVNLGGIVLDIMGMSDALRGGTTPLPIVGDIHIIG